MDAGKVRSTISLGNSIDLRKLAKRMYDDAENLTTWGSKNIKSEKEYLQILKKYYKMKHLIQ